MTKKTKKTTNTLLALATLGCVVGGTLMLSAQQATAETATPTYGYNAVFQDDFNDGQLKEGWEYVSNGTITDNAVTFGSGTYGKMLYNVGASEYAVSADITLTPYATENDDGSTTLADPNIHMPIAVTDPVYDKEGERQKTPNRIGQGVSINFHADNAKLWDWYNGATVKTLESATTAFEIRYENLPNYSDTWLASSHEWKTVVGKTYIECYVDGYFAGRVATPAFMTSVETLYSGIGSNASGKSTITYDNFTVWTKDENNTAASSLYDFSNIMSEEEATANGVGIENVETGGTKITFNSTYDKTAAIYTAKTEDFVVLKKENTYSDFTMKIDVNSYFSSGIRVWSGIYFHATENADGTINGYRLCLGNGKNQYLYIHKVINDSVTSTEYTALNTAGKPYDKSYPVTLTVKGNSFYLTYKSSTTSSVVTEVLQDTDNSYTSGYFGLRWLNKTDSTFGVTFTLSIAKPMEDPTTALTKVKLTNTTETKSYFYSARKDAQITDKMLPHDVIGFVDDNNKLYATHNVADGDAKVLTLDTFTMLAGASVRVPKALAEGEEPTDDISGIRFTADIGQMEFASLANYGVSIDELGMLVIPTDKFGGELTVDTETVVQGKTDKLADTTNTAGEAIYRYRATLMNIPDTDYETKISARGYIVITYTVDGETVTRTLYTDYNETVNSRSIKEVADLAIADTEEFYKLADNQKEKLTEYAAGNVSEQ